MSQIIVTNLTFRYDGSYDNVFENVSLCLDTDWKLGFIGRNGRGKTTFLKLLMGEYDFSGSISASVDFAYFPFDAPAPERDTLAVIRSICPTREEWALHRELSLLDIGRDCLFRPFNTLSNGERTRALLAAMFLKENNFLLIDEPTNHLDMEARETLAQYLKKKKGFILVSHDRVFLDGVIDHVLSINRADIELQQGNYSTWARNRELQDSYERRENERLAKEIGHLAEAARRTSGWSDKLEKTKHGVKSGGLRPDRGYIGAKSAKMMKRSKVTEARRQKAVEDKKSLLKNVEKTAGIAMSPLVFPQRHLMNASGLSVAYGDRVLFEGLHFDLGRGDRIAVCGRNGSGKSSLLRLLAGEDVPHGGNLRRGSNLIISIVPQDTSFLSGGLAGFAEAGGVDPALYRSMLRKLGLSREQFEKDLSDFSDGQKKKALLALSLCQRAHVYIWDEPLNFIDVISRRQVEELILKHGPTMIFVEHDRAFVDAVATKTIEL